MKNPDAFAKLAAVYNRLTPRWRKRLKWAGVILLAYTIVGFFILPIIVRRVAVKQLRGVFDREVEIKKVRINPFTLSASIRGLLIKDKDGQPFISWDEAYANFQLSSFFGKAWVFKEVRTTRPYIRVQVNPDSSFNFSDLLAKFSAAPPRPGPKKPLYLVVGKLQISGARASVTDLTPSTPFHRIIGPIEVTLTGFHTDPENKNPYAFSGTTDSGELFSWSGHFFLDPIRSEGDVTLTGLSISKYAPLYQDLVRFDIKDGVVDLRSGYRVSIGETNFVAAVSNASFSLKSLKIAPRGESTDLVDLKELTVRHVNADVGARTARIGSVFVSGGQFALKRNPDETVNLIEAAKPSTTNANASGGVLFLMRAATNVFAALLHSTNLVSATLDDLQVTNCAFTWEDLVNTRPVRVDVDQIAVSARHFSNLPGSNMTATVSFLWNTNGSVRVDTESRISPPAGDIKFAVHDLELRPLDPYLEPFLNLYLIDSKVSLDGGIRMRLDTNGLPEVTFKGDARMDDFATVDGVMTEDLLKWKSVRLSGLEANLNPPTLAVKEIALLDLYAHVSVETNSVLNVMNVLKSGKTNAPAPAAEAASAPVAPVKSKGGLGARFGGLLTGILGANTNAGSSTPLPEITIDAVVLSNACVRFNDHSLQPLVNASLDELNGTITRLSSRELNRADVHLTGKVDGTGPIEINGKINPLNQSATMELQITFHDIDLLPVSPYTGKFLGYRLTRGKLDLNINYEVADRKLKAQNVILLDQFTLGEKVESTNATKLPVRLAINLLKDRNGMIKLDVPIDGNLDDPEFHLHRVIWHTIGNIFTRIITSPFAALGSLFGGHGEEVSYQDFAPGSAELPATGLGKLDALLNGLNERPGLQLEIEGSFDPATDRDALRRRNLELTFQRQRWSTLGRSERARVSPEQIKLTDSERERYLQLAYASLTTQSNAAAAMKASGGKPPGGAPSGIYVAPVARGPEHESLEKGATVLMEENRMIRAAAPVSEVERAVLATVPVTDEELRQLALQRARSVQLKILMGGKLEADRVFLAEAHGTSTNQTSRVYFHLR